MYFVLTALALKMSGIMAVVEFVNADTIFLWITVSLKLLSYFAVLEVYL